MRLKLCELNFSLLLFRVSVAEQAVEKEMNNEHSSQLNSDITKQNVPEQTQINCYIKVIS